LASLKTIWDLNWNTVSSQFKEAAGAPGHPPHHLRREDHCGARDRRRKAKTTLSTGCSSWPTSSEKMFFFEKNGIHLLSSLPKHDLIRSIMSTLPFNKNKYE